MAKLKAKLESVPLFTHDTMHTVDLSALLVMLNLHGKQWMRSIVRPSDHWNGYMSYWEALKAAELGEWSAPQIRALTLPELTSESDEMRYYNDFYGGQLDIAAYCAGEPEHWQIAEPVYKPCGRILRLAVEIGGLGDVDAEHLKHRGEAIIAMVNSLELQGYSVEVTVVRAYSNAKRENYKFLIPIKNAGQSIDIKRFQFVIGHPAFYRRCLFGLTELAQGCDLHSCGTFTQSYAPEGYIHIPHNAGLGTEQFAMDWAKQFALSFNESQN